MSGLLESHTKEAPLAFGSIVQRRKGARHLSVENYLHQFDMYLTSNALFELFGKGADFGGKNVKQATCLNSGPQEGVLYALIR